MPRRTYKEYSRVLNALIAKYGITERPATDPPTTTTTFDAIMKPPLAETPASSDETPDKRDATPDNARGPS